MDKEDFALFLGMLCGDWHLSIHTKRRVLKNTLKDYYDYYTGFCNTDERLLKIFSDLFYKIFNVKGNFYPRDRTNRKRIYEFHSYSKEVFDKISSLGFPIGDKRDNLRIPEIIKEGSVKEKLSFFFGVLITDGCIRKNKTIIFHSGSKLFLEDLSDLFLDLFCIKRKITEHPQGKFISYQLNLNKQESRKVLDMPPSHSGIAPVLSLDKVNFIISR